MTSHFSPQVSNHLRQLYLIMVIMLNMTLSYAERLEFTEAIFIPFNNIH